jgi:hypothetical protein
MYNLIKKTNNDDNTFSYEIVHYAGNQSFYESFTSEKDMNDDDLNILSNEFIDNVQKNMNYSKLVKKLLYDKTYYDIEGNMINEFYYQFQPRIPGESKI